MTSPSVTGVVLAAGRSSRLGTPKQVLSYRKTTVLGASLDTARDCGFDQIIVTVGAAEPLIRDAVALDDVDVVAVEDAGTGCSASLRVALRSVRPAATGIVLLLGDQPGVEAATVRRLIAEESANRIALCRYDDGLGHPFWFHRGVFDELSALHGDKGIWKLVHSGRFTVHEMPVAGPVPLDVDTWADYWQLVGAVSS